MSSRNLLFAVILIGLTLPHGKASGDSGWPISDEERQQSLKMYDQQKALEKTNKRRHEQAKKARRAQKKKTTAQVSNVEKTKAVTQAPDPKAHRWSAFGGFGASLGSSNYDLSNSSTSITQSDSASGITLDIGASYVFHPHFLLAGELDIGNSNLLFLASPRWQDRRGVWAYWAGLGVGMDSISTSNYGSASGFAISPEIGIDRDLGSRYFAGGQLSYISTSTTLSSTGAGSAFPSVSVSRHWVSLAIRGGIRF